MTAVVNGIENIQSTGLGPATEERTAVRPNFVGNRLVREYQTLAAMVRCYCRFHHGGRTALCPECQGLLNYAAVRLERCRFGLDKPVCAKCPVHCYQRARRKQVKAVMRYAGPRMLWRHPILSLRHWIDGFRTAPGVV
jgi:hypothetical protein